MAKQHSGTGEKSLYETLQANKAAKQEAFEEVRCFSSLFSRLVDSYVNLFCRYQLSCLGVRGMLFGSLSTGITSVISAFAAVTSITTIGYASFFFFVYYFLDFLAFLAFLEL